MPEILHTVAKNSEKKTSRSIELLAPARDLNTALVALSAGADAVYVGAPQFGARNNAAVPLADIETLCGVAHRQAARVFVALNTVLFDNELPIAQSLIHSLYNIGVDALIIQDMGLLQLELPPIPLHASTQCHNASIEQIRLLQALGFEQIVLPREMSLEDTKRIKQLCPNIRYESFVHGALCVSYSGRCYISQALQQRSANRRACAHYCRMSYDLVDACGEKICTSQYLLSLKDLNRTPILQQMIEVGIDSFKIEGRLKNATYVRNTVAHYRKQLDAILSSHSNLGHRSSLGYCKLNFDPNVTKSFHRGFTTYNRSIGTPTERDIINPNTSKSIGENIGILEKAQSNTVSIKYSRQEHPEKWHNGDGLFFIALDGDTEGALVNGIRGNTVVLSKEITLPKGTTVYRNLDIDFERQLNHPTASVNLIPVILKLFYQDETLSLSIQGVEFPLMAIVSTALPFQSAQKDARKTLTETLNKLVGSGLIAQDIQIEDFECFVPLSIVASLKRDAVKRFLDKIEETSLQRRDDFGKKLSGKRAQVLKKQSTLKTLGRHLPKRLPYTYNVTNEEAKRFYQNLGVEQIDNGLECFSQKGDSIGLPLMYTHHCLLNYLGYCTRTKRKPPFLLPLFLHRGKQKLQLRFNCHHCRMEVYQFSETKDRNTKDF